VEGYTITNSQGQKIYLIDTPGFDDTQTSDVELLHKIASALDGMYYNKDIRFAGLLYMHRITDQRVAGSSLKSLRIFEKLCGEQNYCYVTLVTTMWNLLSSSNDFNLGVSREQDLKAKEEFFGQMIAGGAKLARDKGDTQSARAIIDRISQQRKPIVTALQRELAHEGRTIGDTTVGSFLSAGLEQARKRYDLEMLELESALQEAQKEHDEDLISTIAEQRREYEKRVRRMTNDEKTLSITKNELAKFRHEWCTKMRNEAEQKREEAQIMANQIAHLETTIRQMDDRHEKEVSRIKREAKGNEKALRDLSARFEAEKQSYISRLNQRKAQRDATAMELRKFGHTAGFLDRIARLTTLPPSRVQSFTLNFFNSRRDAKQKATSPKVKPKKPKKLRQKQMGKDRATTTTETVTSSENAETEWGCDSMTSEDTVNTNEGLELCLPRSQSTPAQSLTDPPAPAQSFYGYPFALHTQPLGPPRRIPDQPAPTYQMNPFDRNEQ
jgi:hypothetical protein